MHRLYRLVFTAILALLTFDSFANITITAATGGTNISADKAVGSISPGFTALTDIVLASTTVATDFPTGSGTFTLSIPTTWQCQASVGTIVGGGSITVTSYTINANSIVVSYTNAAANLANKITISGLMVQPIDKKANAVNITRASGGTTIPGFASAAVVTPLSEIAGAFVKLQLIVPGETAAPGTATGKTGTPSQQNSGTAMTVTVNGVDANWNRVLTLSTESINVTTTDINGTSPVNATLASGTKTFSVTLRTLGSTATVTATDVTDPTKTANTSPAITVKIGAFAKLQILLPGETAASGTLTGKTGTPTQPVAGTAFNVTVNAVDAGWNVVNTITDIVGITSTDLNAVLPANTALTAGTASLSITLKTAAAKTITASHINTPAKTANTSPSVTILPGAFVKLQLIITGETASPGSVTGKTGTPTVAPGVVFNAVARAVDAYWNLVNTVTDSVQVSTNDLNATLSPVKAPLVAGTKTFKVTLRTNTTTATVTITDITDGTKTSNTSPNIIISTGTFAKLLLLLPGETHAPGTATGKTGTPTNNVAGTPFDVTAYAVDAAFNLVNTVTDEVNITTTDLNSLMPANANLIAGVKTFNVVLKTAGTAKTIKASDITNTAKTAYTTPKVPIVPGAFSKLLVLMPGEVLLGGAAPGKTTAVPTAAKAGTAVTIKVYPTDIYYNPLKTPFPTDSIALTSTDVNATMPAKKVVSTSGYASFSVTFKTIGTQTVTATDFTDGTKTANTSASFSVIKGTFAKLLLLLPGETHAPGTATGKSGTPDPRVAGSAFNVTVYSVDAAWNLIDTNDVVRISSTDTYAALPANTALVTGAATLSITFKTAGSKTLTASDITHTSKTSNTSAAVTIAPGAYSKLLILFPMETFAPGSPTGKSGSANTGSRGVPFDIVVKAVDNNYNLVNTVGSTITLSSSDADATLPAPTALSGGTANISGVNIEDATSSPLPTLTATDGSISTTRDVPLGVTSSLATDYFRTQKTGDWDDIATWESSSDSTDFWHDATLTPTSSSKKIWVQNNHIVTITNAVSIDQALVEPDGEIDINPGITLTLASGGAYGIDVNGTINNAGNITTNSSLIFRDASKYQHNYTTTLGTIPSATWATGALCEVIGYTSASGNVGGTNQTFGNFTWNCPNQTADLSLNGTGSFNDFSILTTGTGTLSFGSGNGTITTRGDFDLEDGTVTINTATGTLNFNVNGDFNMSGGILQKGTGTANAKFAGTTTQRFIKTGGTITGAVSFIANTNAIVDFGEYILDGSAATFTMATGSSILTNNELGFTASGANGAIQTGGTRTYSTTGNYTFNGTSAQVVGSGVPATVNNLTVINPDGVTMPAGTADYTVTNQLTLTSGNLDMGTNRLLVGVSFTTAGTGTLKTQNTSSTPIPAGKTWTVGVLYNAATAQTLVNGNFANLAFAEDGVKTATAGTINVTGNWTSEDGKIDLLTNSAVVTFTGTTQLLTDGGSDDGAGVVFKNVTFGNSGSKTLSAGKFSVSSQGLLTMAGTASLAANGNLTLISDATGTGSVAPLTGSSVITGNVNVQRFITGGNSLTYRGYRLLSSPISVPSAANTFYNFSFLKGSGTYLTGGGGASSGFDVAGNPTLYLYREDKKPDKTSFTAGNYRAVTAINNTPAYLLSTIDGDFEMPVGNGFLFFFRGNNGTNPATVPSDVVLSTLGTLNQGQIVVKNWFKYSTNKLSYTTQLDTTVRGFNLVGNPYPSSIDWRTAFNGTMSTGIYAPRTDQTIYIYNVTSRNYATYLNTSATTGAGTNGGSYIIPSGQGFFVHATDSLAELVFNESAKANAQPGALLLNTAVPTISRNIRLQLSKDTINTDENVIIFNNSAKNNYIKNEDALYLKGSGAVSLSHLSADNKYLAINQLPFPKKTQIIPLNVAVTAAGNYQLNLNEINNIPDLFDIWLRDAYTNDSLDIKNNPVYDFNVSPDAATSGANRFKLVITPNPALMANLLNFNAAKNVGNVKISWTAENEADYTRYVLERSTDGGKTFLGLDSLTSIGAGRYDDLDPYPAKGENQYRLKQTDLMGNVLYSKVVKVMYADQSNNMLANNIINAYPNPTKATLNLAIGQTNANVTTTGNYKITITNSSGITVVTQTSAQATWQGDVSKLLPGSYFVQVQNLKDNKMVGRTSFIKL